MFRRSRFSFRPNVSTAGRTAAAAAPQEAPPANQEASETPRDVSESSPPPAVTDTKTVVTPSEKPTAPGDGNDQNGEGTSSSAAVQRRKRFSVKPKVAPGRTSALSRTPKSPVKAVSETPVEVPVSHLDKPTTSSQTGAAAVPQGLQSPKRRRPSGESKQPKVQPPPTPIPSDSPGPSAVPQAEESPEQTNLPTDSGKQLESKSGTRGKDVPPRPSDKVPPSLPDKEAVEISEKAKTLVSLKSGLSLSPSAFSLSRLLNDPSDLQRLAKAQKLRELLKQERHKEKKLKKAKTRPKEYTLDPAKMTMRDLIRYLPLSNPMTSSLEESVQENETVVPPSPVREESPERAQEPEDLPKVASPRGEEEEEVAEEEDQDDSLMVPQVKVAEDGSLIIDEESLTVEVQRAKGPNPAQDRDPIFERGSTTTYSSFRKGTYSKPWSSEETDMFFLAISMVGTDFSMICQLFPHRARSEIKNKFKKEERENAWRIDKAFRERRKLDIEYFSKLLEKVLEFQKNRKKLKKLTEKNSPKKHKRKAKGKKAAKKLSDVEEEDEEDENEVPDLEDEEEEGEKENEDLCNEGGTPVAKPKRQRKRKTKQAAMNEEPNEKKKKTDEQSSEQGEACTPEQTEAALPEDGTSPDMSEKTDSVDASKDTAIKPAKLSRGRAPKPLLPLGRKWGKKAPPPSTKAKDTASDKGDESVSDGASKEQENKDSSPSRQANKRKSANTDISSEEEDAAVQHPRPTRYGRVPKPINPLNYPAKEDAHTSATEPTPSSPEGSTASVAKPKPKCSAKRGRSSKQKSTQESKKPKLVTLRATRLDYSDDEDEKQRDHEEIEEEEEHPACSPSKDSIAPVFVPASLRSPQPVISEVEETMEELDILANMPDVLGISQDALCPDASCERAQNETGTTEPCEHQLDLLVDVIDFLSSEHTEVSEDESYNEAAQTLLTIGNLTHLPQSVQNQLDTQDHITGTTSVSVIETTQHLEEETAPKPAALQEENSATPLMSGHGVTETPETVATVDPQYSTTDGDNFSIIKTSDQICVEQSTVSDMDPSPQLQSGPESSKKDSPQTRRGRLSKVKPKPNLGRASRTAQAKFPPDTSTAQIAEDSNTEGTNIQVTDSLSAPEETAPKTPEYSPMLLIGDTVSQVESGATTSENQSQCRDANPTPISKVHDKPITGVELEATCDTSLENPSQSTGPPSFDLGSTLTPTDELSTTEGGRTDDGLVGQVYFVTATSDQSTSENQNLSEDLFEESKTHGETTESSNNLVTSDSALTESEVGHDTAPVQESSDQPVTCVTPVDDVPVSQKSESEVASTSTCQSRRSRLQKVKPKPNLPKTSRTARLTPQTTKDPLEKDSSPTPVSKVPDKPIPEVEPEATCDTSPENPSQSTGPASVCIPSFDLGSTLTPTDELSTTEESRTDDGLVGQVYFVTATSDQSTSENQNLSEDLFEESKTHGETTESSNNLVTSDSAVTESEVGHDTTPVQESSVQPATCVTPVEDLPVSQKSESEVASTSTCQSRRSRLQKVKPKPNLPKTSRTARSTPQTAKDPLEKDSSPTPVSKVPDKPIPEVEPEATCDTSPENPSQSTGPASFDLGSTLTPTQELSTTEERRTDDGLVGQVYSVTATSDQSTSENQNLSEDLFEPSSRDTGSTSESTDEKGTTCGKTTESSNNLVTSDSAVRESQVEEDTAPVQWRSDQPATCVTPVKDLPVSQKSERVVTSTCQTRKGRFQKVKPKPNLTQTARTAQSKPQTTKDPVTHMQLVERPPSPISKSGSTDSTIAAVEEQPICSITLPIKPSQSTDTASVSVPSLELCTTDKPAEESPSTVAHKTDVGLNSSSESSKPAVTQRRRHFPKVKPNLGSSTRTTQTKLQPKNISKPSEQQYTDTSSHVTSEQQPVDNSQTEVKFAEKDLSSDSERTLESTNDEYTSSDDALAASLVAENQSVLTDSVPENKSSENSSFERDSPGDKMSNNDGVEAGPSSRGDVSTRVSESNTQPPDDPAAVSDVQSSEEGSTESKINPVLAAGASSIPDPKESGPQPRSESDSEVKSQDAAQQYSEARETNQTSNDKSQSPQTANDADAKAPQTPRGRLIKPKPNLGPSSGTPQVQSTTQAEADSGSHSEDVHASVSHEPVCELQPDIQEPVEGAVEPHISQESSLNDSGSLLGCLTEIIEQLSQHDSPRNDAGSSLGCVTQAQDHSSQSTSTLSIEGTQSRPSLTIFPEMLSEQVPSDPDEPFFILSLTEIPVCSSGQVVDSAAEPLPYLPAADASIEHRSSVPGESLASAGEGSLSDVPVLMCTEESGEVGHVGVKDAGPDPAAYIDSITENPVDPPESTTCQPPESPETAEKNEETEISPTKQRLTRRRAKLQVKPNATRKKHAGKSLATNTDRDSELPEASTQPDASDATAKQDDEVDAEPQKRSGDHVNIKKEGPAGEKDPEDRSSGAQTRTTKTRATSVGNSAAPLNDPSPGDAASRGPKVKTPRTTRKHSTPATPVASTSHNFASTPNQTQLPDDTHSPSTTSLALTEVDIELTPEHNRLCSDSTPSTSQSTDEVSASQGSDCVESGSAEEEPTSVSQYFLTDIFTEVEEG
ncbi:transcription factor TFIIIB component B'' homolog isoform X1 [Seriola aureovittata]|uniref:transcription factor TFIIIB component B'' homolog isoform X1 n=1 Tax=Seriola aureovittata TaxID=2871759 RepID=UPI0024BDB321|nr:transcription factor TFIIIB component B'' homolog isoform X1 [Seriola aureovittata]